MKKKIALLTSGWSVDYVVSIIHGLQKACAQNNIDLYIFSCYKFSEPDGSSNDTGFAIFDLINYKDYDGVIITPHLFNDEEIVKREVKRIKAAKIPAVSLAAKIEGFHFVNSDNITAAEYLVYHLAIEHNIKKFAYIGGPAENQATKATLKAYKQVLNEQNLPLIEENIILDGDWTYKRAYSQAVQLLTKKDLPEAIVCINDTTAMAVSKAAAELSIKIPDELKVIAFDNSYYSSRIIPSITSLSFNPDKVSYAAVSLILANSKKPEIISVPGDTLIRQSCGCVKKITSDQILFSQNYPSKIDDSQRFTSQLRHMEDIFIRNQTIEMVAEDLQDFFAKRHIFEGPDFAICLKEEVVKTLTHELKDDDKSETFGPSLQLITNIQDGTPAPLGKLKTRALVPDNMKSDKPEMYLFLPIFNQKYLHGYYVAKNCTLLLNDKNAYNWTRNVGTIIEKFRQTFIYRRISEEYQMLSTRDALSGLLNRAGLDSFVAQMFKENNKNNLRTEIIFIDINNMKIINDKHGHLHGDLAVKTVAESIKSSIPKSYLAVRYGGDEFVVMGPYDKKKNTCNAITQKLKLKSESLNLPYTITASIGSKVFEPNEKTELLSAIEDVDKIMYKHKQEFHKSERKTR